MTRHDFHVLALLTASAVASRASRAAKGAASTKLKTVSIRRADVSRASGLDDVHVSLGSQGERSVRSVTKTKRDTIPKNSGSGL